MEPREADLYGRRVLDLLGRARKTLCERYGAEPPSPVIVEIFPQRKEFAVRTFGLPGADGLLGVCFGRVITANSPAIAGGEPLELGSRALARVLPCGDPEQDAEQDAAMAQRGDLGLRGGAARTPPGPPR